MNSSIKPDVRKPWVRPRIERLSTGMAEAGLVAVVSEGLSRAS